RAQPLAENGAQVAESVVEAVSGADVIITMVYDGEAVLDVMTEAAPSCSPTAIWMQSATIGLAATARAAALAEAAALRMVDAPALGTKEPAEQGRLVMLVGGPRSLLPQLQPVLDAISVRTVWAGELPGQGMALKLACNAWIASITAATAQSLTLASGLAVDPQLFLQAIAGGPADCAYAHLKSSQMMAGEFTPSFMLDGAAKDLELITEAAGRAGVDTTLLTALSRLYRTASESGFGKQDIAAVIRAFDADLVGGPAS
ncbi:MAG: 3-hydroxyisobutyrate dehydrogenase, partial [Pseudonocardiales bacterium]|nr:3-hydroxyisobutyrate dehydrogenase [Pseudonocardiales bacterium]